SAEVSVAAGLIVGASGIGAGEACGAGLAPSAITAGASCGNCADSGGGSGTMLAAVSGLISTFACCAIISEIGGVTSLGIGAGSWAATAGGADAAATGAAGAAATGAACAGACGAADARGAVTSGFSDWMATTTMEFCS